jgi:hypothetical protein
LSSGGLYWVCWPLMCSLLGSISPWSLLGPFSLFASLGVLLGSLGSIGLCCVL